ncbi:MAG: hypothetical protein GVY04_18300 [Cyanobacteria bacterium]|jgi:hypothetical protein|nr:hypothetical protein [Cyanobacteria bacterium GSL.Bin1]
MVAAGKGSSSELVSERTNGSPQAQESNSGERRIAWRGTCVRAQSSACEPRAKIIFRRNL